MIEPVPTISVSPPPARRGWPDRLQRAVGALPWPAALSYAALAAFELALTTEPPPLAVVERVTSIALAPESSATVNVSHVMAFVEFVAAETAEPPSDATVLALVVEPARPRRWRRARGPSARRPRRI